MHAGLASVELVCKFGEAVIVPLGLLITSPHAGGSDASGNAAIVVAR